MASVIERLRELHNRWVYELLGSDPDAIHRQRMYEAAGQALPALLALADAVKASPCRHTADHTGDTCPVCKALAELEKEAG